VTDLTDAKRIERARQASLALKDFLDPAFELVVASYLDRVEQLASTTPWEAGKITALSNAARIAKEVRGQIAQIVADGADARSNIDRAKRIEELTPARKRLLKIGAF
jgi:hypothetical protein